MYWTNYFSFFSRENKEKKKRKPIDYVQLEKLELPIEIANMDKNTTKEFLKDEFSIYASLKFKSADFKTLNEKNYHSIIHLRCCRKLLCEKCSSIKKAKNDCRQN